MKKGILYAIACCCSIYCALYFFRWEFRNKEDVPSKVINTLFNLNTIHVEANGDRNITIKWFGKNQSGDHFQEIIFDHGKGEIGNMKNLYGVNAFSVFDKNVLLETFSFHKDNWFDTYDFSFRIMNDSVMISSKPMIKFHSLF